jgi:hypothetical protein
MSSRTQSTIWITQARVTDKAAIAKVLAPLPPTIAWIAWAVARQPGGGCCAMDFSRDRAYWSEATADGVLICVTFEPISLDQTFDLEGEIHCAGPSFNEAAILGLYSKVTGVPVEWIRTRIDLLTTTLGH